MPDARPTTIDVKHANDGSVEVRIFGDARHQCWALIYFPLATLAALLFLYSLARDVDRLQIWVLFFSTTVFNWFFYRTYLDTRSAHRIVASDLGIRIERVSPAGYITRRQLGRKDVKQVRVRSPFNNTQAIVSIIRCGWGFPHRITINHPDRASLFRAAGALRDALGLAPVDDHQ